MRFREPWRGQFKKLPERSKSFSRRRTVLTLDPYKSTYILCTFACRRHSALTTTCSTNQIKSTRKATVAFYRGQFFLNDGKLSLPVGPTTYRYDMGLTTRTGSKLQIPHPTFLGTPPRSPLMSRYRPPRTPLMTRPASHPIP